MIDGIDIINHNVHTMQERVIDLGIYNIHIYLRRSHDCFCLYAKCVCVCVCVCACACACACACVCVCVSFALNLLLLGSCYAVHINALSI